MVFQHFGLLPHRRVVDNVALGLEIRGDDARPNAWTVRRRLDLVGLRAARDGLPGPAVGRSAAAGGPCRALAVDPEVLFFDEPFSALDPLIRRDMQNEVIRLHDEMGKTMVFITHDLSEALKLGDHVAIMRAGEIVQIGRPEEIVGAPAETTWMTSRTTCLKTNVLTLGWIKRPVRSEDPLDGPEMAAAATIRSAVHVAAGTESPDPDRGRGNARRLGGPCQILSAIAGVGPDG